MLQRLLSPLPTFGLALSLVIAASAVPMTVHAFKFEVVGGGTKVIGSGLVTDQVRVVSAFSKLRLDGAITVEAKPSSMQSVTVRADDNIAALVTTEVQGDTLVVSTRSGTSFRTNQPVVVSVNFVTLKAAELRGSGDLNISSIQGDRFDAAVAGSGDLRIAQANLGQLSGSVAGSGDLSAKGKATEVQFSVAGSGDIHGAELIAQRGSVNMAGSGDARVHATDTLAVNIVGSGDVWVSGNPPKLSQSVVGSGEVRRKP